MLEQLYTIKEFANELGMTESFVRKLLYERKIKRTKVGKCTRFTRAQIDEYLATLHLDEPKPKLNVWG